MVPRPRSRVREPARRRVFRAVLPADAEAQPIRPPGFRQAIFYRREQLGITGRRDGHEDRVLLASTTSSRPKRL
jgi:hypothetical protein